MTEVRLCLLLCFTSTTFTQIVTYNNDKKKKCRKAGEHWSCTGFCKLPASRPFEHTLYGCVRWCGTFQTGASVVRLGVCRGRWG